MPISGYSVDTTNVDNFAVITLHDYANTTTKKVINSKIGFIQTTTSLAVASTDCFYNNDASAITSLGFQVANGNTWSAGSVEIYGVK